MFCIVRTGLVHSDWSRTRPVSSMSQPPSYELSQLTLLEKPESFPGQQETSVDRTTPTPLYPEVLIDGGQDNLPSRPASARASAYFIINHHSKKGEGTPDKCIYLYMY